MPYLLDRDGFGDTRAMVVNNTMNYRRVVQILVHSNLQMHWILSIKGKQHPVLAHCPRK